MQKKDVKYFGNPSEGALNADDSAFALLPNQWLNSENIRSGSTDKGVTGIVESIGSTRLISQPQPSINYITIGSEPEIERNRFCEFKFNTTGRQDKIVCYDEVAGIEYDVLLSSQVIGGLNFSKESPIHSARIVNGLLYWVDSTNNQPRKINIDSAILANNPSYVTEQPAYIFPLNFSEITILKPTEIKAPLISKGTDMSVAISRIYNESFQFAWQYVYYDNETTVTSMYSLASFLNAANETYNVIQAQMNASEQIPNTVRIVNLICRIQDGTVTGGDNAFVIKTWDKEISAEAVQMMQQNSGFLSLFYNFYNTSLGVALAEIDVLRPFDNVPIYSESLETAKDLLFLANNTEGYDAPKTTSLQLSTTKINRGSPTALPCFVGNAPYLGGIIFADYGMRRCGTVTNQNSNVTTPIVANYTLDGFSAPSVTSLINWQLSNGNAINEIPDWAYYVIPVLTLNQRTRFLISSINDSARYVTKDSSGNYVYSIGAFPSGCYGLAINTTNLITAGLGYVYNVGDICSYQYLSRAGGDDPPVIITKNVIAQDGQYIIIQPQNIGNLNNLSADYYEIYTPYISSVQEPYYDQGQIYKINNPGMPNRSYSVLSGSFYPDSFVLSRSVFGITYYAMCMSPNDLFYKRWDSNISRPNFVTKLGQAKKTQYVSWSNTFIPNTAINGLSTFLLGNETNVPQNCGAINKLILTSKVSDIKEGNVMLSICANETNSMYLGETQITDSAGQNQFFSGNVNVIGTINTLKGSSGTINPESVTAYRGQVWWLDTINGRITQYSENGLFFISSLKMVRFWKNWCLQYNSMTAAQIESLGGRPFVFMIVDSAHDELLISIPKLSNTPPQGYLPDYPNMIYPFDILDFQGKTIVYKLEKSDQPAHWQGAYLFNPEGFVTLNNQLYGFKNGLLYIHNQTTSYNNFYGVQYQSKIMFVSNENPMYPKVYNNIEVQANMNPFFVYLYNSIPEQQSSDLVDFDFRPYEGIFKSPIYRNKLQPTFDGYTTNGLLTGQKMRNVAMFIMIQFNPINTPLELKFVEVGYDISKGQQ